MISEALAFNVAKLTWDSFEFTHLTYVFDTTGTPVYSGINYVPENKLEKKILYEFQVTGDKTKALADFHTQVTNYLTKLNDGLENLRSANEVSLSIHSTLTDLIDSFTVSDLKGFSSHLLVLKNSFESFKNNFNQFLHSIEQPPRQLLYLVDAAFEKGIIKKYNDNVKVLKTSLELLKKTEQDITDKFKQGLNVINTLLSENNLDCTSSFEQLEQTLDKFHINNKLSKILHIIFSVANLGVTEIHCMDDKELSKTIHNILSNNSKLASVCIEIFQMFTIFNHYYEIQNAGLLSENKN